MTGNSAFFASKRRSAVIVALALAALIVAGALYRHWSAPRLNVVLVTFDTVRADHLGTFGYREGLTTDFDDFANRGVVFERAYAPAPLTLPSHTTMLTGLYPPEHGLRINGYGPLSSGVPVLQDILKQHGYDTGAFIAAAVLEPKYGLARGFDTYDLPVDVPRREGQKVVDAALSWLAERTSRPFFCWIHLYDAHYEYEARPELFGKKFEKTPYDAGIAVVVQQFQRVLQFLHHGGYDEKTLVIVAGDHGEGLDEHMEVEHGFLVYDTTLHVPLAFVGPRDCRQGLRVAEPVSLADIMPTVLDILRIPAPEHVSGRSLVAAMKGNALASAPCYAEAEAPYDSYRWCPLRAVISGSWKYIETARPELYDLANDPGELRNLADADLDRRQQLRSLLMDAQAAFVQADTQNAKPSERDLANLESLGYAVGAGSATGSEHRESAEPLPDIKDKLPQLAKFEKAKQLGKLGKFEESIAFTRRLIDEADDYPSAYVLLGENLFRLNREDEAVAAYRTALEREPGFTRVRLILAQYFASHGRLEEAMTEFAEITKREPESALPHYEYAEILTAMQRSEEAIVQYREALRVEPGLVVANVRLGDLFAKLERFDEAVPCYERALEFDPKNTAARASLAKIYRQSGKSEKMIALARKAVELDPKSFDARSNLGNLLLSQERYQEAIAELREAQRLRPGDPRPGQRLQQAEAALKRSGK